MLLGLRTVIHPAPDLAAAKAWYTTVLGVEPYFDEPFYVGFQVAGYEFGLDPNGDVEAGPVAYWGADDGDAAVASFVAAGAVVTEALHETGDGIRTALLVDPFGRTVGIIENPVFSLPEPPTSYAGPGR